MKFRFKFLTIYITLVLSLNVHAFNNEDQSSENKLKALAVSDICEGLLQLREVSATLENVIAYVDSLKKVKDNFYKEIEPAFKENYKFGEEIKDDLAELETKERSSCTFLELHTEGPCARIENPGLRLPINKKIVRHNKKSAELAPALEYWSKAYKSIDRQVNLIESSYKKARKILEEGIENYWNAVLTISLAEGNEVIEGVLTKPLAFDDESLFLSCVSNGLDLYMTEIIFDIRMSHQEGHDSIKWYRSVVQKHLAKIVAFSSPTCARQLNVQSLLETIILCKKLKS